MVTSDTSAWGGVGICERMKTGSSNGDVTGATNVHWVVRLTYVRHSDKFRLEAFFIERSRRLSLPFFENNRTVCGSSQCLVPA